MCVESVVIYTIQSRVTHTNAATWNSNIAHSLNKYPSWTAAPVIMDFVS